MFRAGLLAVVLLGACGDQEQFIIFNVQMDSPSLVAYSVNGEWKTPPLIGDHQYGFGVDGDYRFVAVCENDDGTFDAEEIVGRPDPAIAGWNILMSTTPTTRPSGGCYGPSTAATTVVVAGTISELAAIDIYGRGTDSEQGAATWDYALDVKPGTHNLIAANGFTSTDPHVVVRRGLDIASSQVLPPIDLASESVAMIAESIQVGGLPADASSSTSVVLQLADFTSATVSHGYDMTFTVVDPSDLQGDEQDLYLDVDDLSSSAFLSAQAQLAPDLGPITMLPTVSATYQESPTGLVARWGPLPDVSYIAMELDDKTFDSSVRVISQHDYATARGEIAFEAPPNYPTRWTPSWTQRLVDSNRTFEVASSDGSWFYRSSVRSNGDDKSDVRVRPLGYPRSVSVASLPM